MKEIIINGRAIGAKHPPYVIAELSANHNGELQKALDTITKAKACGADAVKLQTYTADTMTIDSNHEEFCIQAGYGMVINYMTCIKRLKPHLSGIKPCLIMQEK